MVGPFSSSACIVPVALLYTVFPIDDHRYEVDKISHNFPGEDIRESSSIRKIRENFPPRK